VIEPFVIVSWPAVPVELVRAAGFRLVLARGSAGATAAADARLEPGIFPSRLRHLVEDALTGRLAGAACIVIPRTSDVDYKCFLYLREFVRSGEARALAPVMLYDLLQSRGADVQAYDVASTRALLARLAALSGRMPSSDDLQAEIARTNAARAAARRLAALRRITPRVTGTEVFPLLAAFWDTDPHRYVTLASEAARDIAARPALAGPRVLLTGAPVDAPVLHQAIESHGAIVVAEVGPLGNAGNAAGEDVRCDAEPLSALADKYRVDSMGARAPADSVRRWTAQMLDAVDAVVVSLPPDDAVFGWDYPALKDLLGRHGVPHVVLRGDPHEMPTAEEHERLDAMVVAASRLSEARHG
jgi:hypothetical protein